MSGRWILALLVAAGCAAPQTTTATDTALPAGVATTDTTTLPAGYGTLRQDELTVSLQDGSLLIKVTPLEERLIRLLAPDTYARLSRLVQRHLTEAPAGEPAGAALFLVSFFSYDQSIAYRPEDLRILYQGRLADASRVTPLTDGFDRRLLSQQVSQSAIYSFDLRIDYDQPFIVRYGLRESDGWATILPRLEVERARIRSRIRGG